MQFTGKHSRQGFTLVELIIVTAITAVILSAIVALFVLALRTVKSGNAAMDANELTRAAFAAMERDLNSAFTAREHGELFHFHGNEVGFSFIGLVRTYDGTSQGEMQLGRVTYVLNPSLTAANNDIDDDGDGNIDNAEESAFDLIPMERLDTSTGEMVDVVLPGETAPGVRTISLIRYFEPGVESLDVYDQEIKATLDTADTFSPTETGIDWRDRFVDARDALDLDNVRDAQIYDEIRRNFRRDAYIRMLANAHTLAMGENTNVVYPDGWHEDLLDRDPQDYVLADNILDLDSQLVLSGKDPTLFPNNIDKILEFPYFLFGRVASEVTNQHNVEFSYWWNANTNVIEIRDNPVGNFGGGWEVTEELPPSEGWQDFGDIGSPLQARLPEFLRVRLPFIFDSPYFGAPHVARDLDNLIRVPSAYTRRNPLAGTP